MDILIFLLSNNLNVNVSLIYRLWEGGRWVSFIVLKVVFEIIW